MSRRALRAGVALACIVATTSSAADRYVHRRTGLDPWRVERVVATPDALVVTVVDRGISREDRLAWDRVAAVDPADDGRLEVGVDSGLELGDRIWRGIRRLQRGDARLARTAFEEASALGPRIPGELAAATLEGLVLAGIAMGDTDRVLADAVLLGDLAAAGVRSDRFVGPGFAGDAVDPATSLVPDVPPVAMSATPDLVALSRRLRDTPAFGDGSATRRDLWRRLIERSGPPDLDERGLDEGARLLLDLCRLDSDDPRTADTARRRLLASIDEAPPWRAAWIRWFAGSAAISRAAEDPEATLAGVLDLVHVLALEDAAPPSLRLRALELAAASLERIGRDEDAATLESILIYERPVRRGTESTP